MAGLGVVLAVLVSIMVYLGWQHGLTLGQIPSILAQTPLWFYVAIAAIVLFAMAVGLRGYQVREAAATKPAPKPRPAAASRARTARPAEEPPAQPRVVVEFVPVGPTIVAEHTEPPFGLPAAEPVPVAEPAPTPKPKPVPEHVPEPAPEPEVVPEPVVDLGPELGSEAPEVARVPPPKPEVALEDLKGWLADTSPEAVSTPRTRALRKEDEPTA